MSTDAFNFLLNHIAFQQAFPSKIDFSIAEQYDPRQVLQTFTRVNWASGDVAVAEMDVIDGDGTKKITMMRFSISTRTRVVKYGEAGIPADSVEPEEADVLMDARITFMMEYLVSGANVDDFDQAAIEQFTGKQVPFNMWPYFREFIQSLAMRSRIPVPVLPPFQLPKKPTNS